MRWPAGCPRGAPQRHECLGLFYGRGPHVFILMPQVPFQVVRRGSASQVHGPADDFCLEVLKLVQELSLALL